LNSGVFRAEKALIKEGFSISLVPTPRQFSSDCGIALRFEWDHAARIQELLNSANVEFSSIQQLENQKRH
jgi:hypothetical protein